MSQFAGSVGPRLVVRSAREAASVAWRAGPLLLVGYLLVMTVGALAPVVAAWLTKLIVDGLAELLTGSGTPVSLVWLAAGLAGAGVVVAATSSAETYLGSEIGRRFVVETTDRLFAATTALPGLRPFEDPQFLDRLRLAQDGTAMAGSTVGAAFAAARSALTLLGFVGSLLVISPMMTVVVLVSAVPALVAQLSMSRWRADLLWQISPTERWRLFYSQLLGRADAAKEIRLFGAGRFLRERMMGHLRTATAAQRRIDRRELNLETALATLAALVSGGGLIWAITAATAGVLSPGDITIFITAVAAVQGALNSLVGSIAEIHHGMAMFGHYVTVIRMAPDLPVASAPAALPPLREGIVLRDVWFRYSTQHPWVLKGVNLAIPAGRTVGLVGINGAGKSTLVKLLCRLYDPDRGEIYWDGIDLRQVDPADLRARITGVFQDHMSYDMSAEDNIAIGDAAHRHPGRIRAAAAAAGLDRVLDELPNGYQTLLTRMFFSEEDKKDPTTGVVLSGGQWQRIALARAYFRDGCDLMILDEPSAGLDPQAEAELHVQTRRCRTGRTNLLISHRLNTIREADLLVVIDDGVVTEQGTHRTLMETDGAYAHLFRLQANGYQSEVSQEPVS